MRTITTAAVILCIVTSATIRSAPACGLIPTVICRGGTTAQSSQIPGKFEKSFVGTIGPNLRVRLDLTANDGTLYGEYFYERIGTSISLDGKISPKGTFVLTERDDSGNATANFNGVAGSRSIKGKTQIVLSGTWSNAAQTKSLPFSIAEEVFDLGAGLDLVSKTIKQTSKKPNYEIDVIYPQVSGPNAAAAAAFDHQVEALVQKEVTEFKKGVEDPDPADNSDQPGSSFSIGYLVTVATPELISVSLLMGEYSAGAAHPNSYSVSISYDIKAGKQLRLSDLFATGKPYLQTISKTCIAQLKKKLGEGADPEWLDKGAGPKAENYKNWNLTTTGLEITFDSYQVAAYAFGGQVLFIQYTDLKPMIKVDGPLGSIVR
jgi:hypothetical protein